MCFPPFGYQPRRTDNRKSCNLNRERLSCLGVMFVCHSMTSFEWYCLRLRALHGQISLFWFENKNYDFNENSSNYGLKYVINRIITLGFGHCPQYQPSTIISPRAKALGLIMKSRVDTVGDNQNPVC